jgi:RNA polymerase sigma factor (sigma-70 family)
MSNTLSYKDTLKGLSDRDIVLGLKASDDELYITQLQYEFYRRYAPYVFKVAIQRCQIFKDAEGFAKEITQLTFIKALQAIRNFNIQIGLTDKIFKKTLKAWLGRIANNNFNKLYAEYRNEDIDVEILEVNEPSYNLFDDLYDLPAEEQPSEVLTLLREGMQILKEIDRHILTTYAGEGCLNTTQHLSDNAMNILCETYKTTSENIRQRKNRAYKKLKQYCLKD